MDYDKLYKLPLIDSNLVNESILEYRDIERFYCSYVSYVKLEGNRFRLTSNDEMDTIRWWCDTTDTIVIILRLICIVLGIPGNIMAIITMATTKMSTPTFYILVLAVADLAALIVRSVDILILHFDLINNDYSCKWIYSVNNYCSISANWVLVLISFERFIAICFPLKKRNLFPMRRAKLSVVLLLLSLTPVIVVELTAIKMGRKFCITTTSMDWFYNNIWIHVRNALFSFIPIVLIFVFMLLCVHALRKRREKWGDVLERQTNVGRNGPSARQYDFQLNKMMLLTFATFLVLTIPACIAIAVQMSNEYYGIEGARNHFILVLTSTLSLLSHAVNFYIYLVSARGVRSHVCDLMKRCFKL